MEGISSQDTKCLLDVYTNREKLWVSLLSSGNKAIMSRRLESFTTSEAKCKNYACYGFLRRFRFLFEA